MLPQVTVEENCEKFKLVTHDEYVQLVTLEFRAYFASCGARVLYPTVRFCETLKSTSRRSSITLTAVVEITYQTTRLVGIAEHVDRIKDKLREPIKEDEVMRLFSKAMVEEAVLRGLI